MKIDLGDKPPVFAHDVAISTVFRAEKTKKGKFKKESCTELVFFDGIKKQAIARIIVPFGILKALPKLIEMNVKKIKKELRNKDLPTKQIVETKSTETSYLG